MQQTKTVYRTKDLVRIIQDLIKGHVGESNAIKHDVIFKQLFGHLPKKSDPSDFIRNVFLSRAMGNIRRRTDCFVIYKYKTYFIISNQNECDDYTRRLERRKDGLIEMQKRAKRSIKEKWYLKYK